MRHKHDGSFYWVRYYQDHWARPHHAARMSHSQINRLSEWEAIDDGVLSLIQQFENNTKQGERQ